MQTQSILITISLCIIIHTAFAINDISSEENSDFLDTCEIGSYTGNWKDCANSLSTLIWNTHTWYDDQPITICELKCSRELNGHVSRFQWVWDAQFQCEEKAPGIIGKAEGFKVRRDAMKSAIAQTIEHGIRFGKLTPNDFIC
jgi:hypothetical protein